MKGYKVSFNVFAESQEEADAVSRLLGDFVNDCARKGVAVTAAKMADAARRWGGNPFVRGRVESYFK